MLKTTVQTFIIHDTIINREIIKIVDVMRLIIGLPKKNLQLINCNDAGCAK